MIESFLVLVLFALFLLRRIANRAGKAHNLPLGLLPTLLLALLLPLLPPPSFTLLSSLKATDFLRFFLGLFLPESLRIFGLGFEFPPRWSKAALLRRLNQALMTPMPMMILTNNTDRDSFLDP